MRSMTGYGRMCVERDGRRLTAEVKSVNNRFLDVAFRVPRHLGFLEEPLRARVARALSRGHVDVTIAYVNLREDARRVSVDQGLMKAYRHALSEIEAETGLESGLTAFGLASMSDVLVVEQAEENQEAVRMLAEEAIDGALAELLAMREREGEALARDILSRLDALARMNAAIEARYPETVREYTRRLNERLSELLGENGFDPQRVLQEAALMADRSAVAEETVRLTSHFAQMRAILAELAPAGRKLDFLVQELNREFNTISSKSQDIDITRLVVDAKAEVEKIREQVQNVE